MEFSSCVACAVLQQVVSAYAHVKHNCMYNKVAMISHNT
jgi:hypothetical protein